MFEKKFARDFRLTLQEKNKPWLKIALFSDWLQKADAYTGRTPQHVLLLMDSCLAHGASGTQPHLQNYTASCFSPNTTRKSQTIDFGTVAAMKVSYSHREMEHAVDLMETITSNILQTNLTF